MRNTTTDTLGAAMNNSFIHSGLSLEQFRDVLLWSRPDIIGYPTPESLFVFIKGDIAHFYFVDGEWWCKF
jgi:hypothetical protein